MKYQLKPNFPDFRIVDGVFKGRIYRAGEQYDEKDIPPQEKNKFEPAPIQGEVGERPDNSEPGEKIGEFIEDEQKKED